MLFTLAATLGAKMKKLANINEQWWLIEEKGGDLIHTPLDEEKAYTIKGATKKRTVLQNASLHKYCSLVAESLNTAGFTVRTTLSRKQDLIIKKTFDWLRDKIPQFKTILDKAENRIFQGQDIEVSWNTLLVKNIMWRQFQMVILDKESTTTLETNELTQVHKHMDNYLTTNIGIEHIPFPSQEAMLQKQNTKNY